MFEVTYMDAEGKNCSEVVKSAFMSKLVATSVTKDGATGVKRKRRRFDLWLVRPMANEMVCLSRDLRHSLAIKTISEWNSGPNKYNSSMMAVPAGTEINGPFEVVERVIDEESEDKLGCG